MQTDFKYSFNFDAEEVKYFSPDTAKVDLMPLDIFPTMLTTEDILSLREGDSLDYCITKGKDWFNVRFSIESRTIKFDMDGRKSIRFNTDYLTIVKI